MGYKQKIMTLITIFSFMSVGWGCADGVEVELWGECYNIEETTTLELSSSVLSGEIPPEIGDLINLTYLNLFSNQLTGEIPPEIGNLTSLSILGLMDNQLSGEIPPEIGNLINLTYLNLYSNQLTGEIPSEIGNLTNLWYLDFQMNQLTGEIPSEIGYLVNLIIFHLNENNLFGEVPEDICDLTIDWSGVSEIHGTMIHFDVGNNNLCPPYPGCIEDYVGYQNTSECEECSEVVGDLNDDFTLDVLDVILMINCILEGFLDQCLDISGDGIVDVLDIIQLVNIIINVN